MNKAEKIQKMAKKCMKVVQEILEKALQDKNKFERNVINSGHEKQRKEKKNEIRRETFLKKTFVGRNKFSTEMSRMKNTRTQKTKSKSCKERNRMTRGIVLKMKHSKEARNGRKQSFKSEIKKKKNEKRYFCSRTIKQLNNSPL